MSGKRPKLYRNVEGGLVNDASYLLNDNINREFQSLDTQKRSNDVGELQTFDDDFVVQQPNDVLPKRGLDEESDRHALELKENQTEKELLNIIGLIGSVI